MNILNNTIVDNICKNVNKQYKNDYSSVINLSSNEMKSKSISDKFKDYINSMDDFSVHKYPYYNNVTTKLAKYYNLDNDNIILSSGTNNAIFIVLNALSKFINKMVIEDPNYESYFEYAKLNQIEIVRLNFDSDPLLNQTIQVIKNINNSIVEITTPHGWSGMKVDFRTIRSIAMLCENNNNILIVDEAYASFGEITYIDLVKEFNNIIIIKSLSKNFGIASLRIGMIISSQEIINYLSRWCPSNTISQISLDFVDYLLENIDIVNSSVNKVIKNREELKKFIKNMHLPLQIFNTYSNFITLRFQCVSDLEKLISIFEKNKIRVKRLDSARSYENCIRITVPEDLDIEFLESLHEFGSLYNGN